MNPERWAAKTTSFAAEREENETGISARRCPSHQRLKGGVCEDEETEGSQLQPQKQQLPNSGLLSTANSERDNIDILQHILKEKAKEIQEQKEQLLSLSQEVALLKRSKISDLAVSNDTGGTISPQPKQCIKGTTDNENANPLLSLSEIIVEKVDLIEKRMDALVSFVQSHFPQSQSTSDDKCRKDVSPPFPAKPWNKPPALQPRATCGSTLREAHSRCNTRSTNNDDHKVPTCEAYNSMGRIGAPSSNFHAYRADSYYDAHRDRDPTVEQRLQFLESLVAQLKRKFVKLLQIQMKNMRKK